MTSGTPGHILLLGPTMFTITCDNILGSVSKNIPSKFNFNRVSKGTHYTDTYDNCQLWLLS